MAIDPRITTAFEKQNGFPLEPHLVVLALMGSHSHGTYLPPQEPNAVDDVDLMGGSSCRRSSSTSGSRDGSTGLYRSTSWTSCATALEKAVRVLLKSNPNIVGLLWLREAEYVHRHPAFDLLRARRDIFSSQAAAEAFAGYAADQLKRMQAFDLERMAEYEALTTAIAAKGRPWCGSTQYDVKNAAHLIRLLRMGSEFIATGTLQVYRTSDADELKVIKRGGWTLDQVKAEAERLFAGVEAARARSPLPAGPGRARGQRAADGAALPDPGRPYAPLAPHVSRVTTYSPDTASGGNP